VSCPNDHSLFYTQDQYSRIFSTEIVSLKSFRNTLLGSHYLEVLLGQKTVKTADDGDPASYFKEKL